MDALEIKQREDARLSREIVDKTQEVMQLIKESAQIRDTSLQEIDSMRNAVIDAHERFIKHLEERGYIERRAGQLIVKRRKRG